jgi:hypothetical protein
MIVPPDRRRGSGVLANPGGARARVGECGVPERGGHQNRSSCFQSIECARPASRPPGACFPEPTHTRATHSHLQAASGRQSDTLLHLAIVSDQLRLHFNTAPRLRDACGRRRGRHQEPAFRSTHAVPAPTKDATPVTANVDFSSRIASASAVRFRHPPKMTPLR